jgi:molybdopterin-guanine dinucleotide biosynthesis protein A
MDVTGIILVGGKSLRFGRNKAIEKIAGMTLIERVIKQLPPINHEIILLWHLLNPPFHKFSIANIKNVV